MPKVSVLMPCYNGAKYILESIDSVLSQSFDDFELIIVDDQSNDDTFSIINAIDDPRVKVYKNDVNQGLVGNWNSAIEKSSGDYIHFLFQDDLMLPGALDAGVKALDSHPQCSLCFSSSNVIDSTGSVTMRRRPFKSDCIFDGRTFARKTFRSYNIYGEPSNVLFRRSAYLEVGPFNDALSYSPDWEYWIRLSLVGDVYYLSGKFSAFRVCSESTTNSLFKMRKELLKRDERDFIEAVSSLGNFDVSLLDLFIRKCSVSSRNIAKCIYFKIH